MYVFYCYKDGIWSENGYLCHLCLMYWIRLAKYKFIVVGQCYFSNKCEFTLKYLKGLLW